MSWRKVAETVGQAAPLLGTVLGGPAGGAIGAVVSSALGVDNRPDSVLSALGDPDAMAKLKQIELAHRAELEAMAVDLAKAELADKANARAAHAHSPMPMVVTGALTVIFAGALWFVLGSEIPGSNSDVAFAMVGQLSALWGASVTYWVGTTRSSAEKTRLMGR